VEHEAAARLAKQRMAAYRRGEDFKAEAAKVYRKLGSRNRPSEGRRKKPTEPLPQLTLDL
jgi:hypothetical protein